jgi:hypothetical protein
MNTDVTRFAAWTQYVCYRLDAVALDEMMLRAADTELRGAAFADEVVGVAANGHP